MGKRNTPNTPNDTPQPTENHTVTYRAKSGAVITLIGDLVFSCPNYIVVIADHVEFTIDSADVISVTLSPDSINRAVILSGPTGSVVAYMPSDTVHAYVTSGYFHGADRTCGIPHLAALCTDPT